MSVNSSSLQQQGVGVNLLKDSGAPMVDHHILKVASVSASSLCHSITMNAREIMPQVEGNLCSTRAFALVKVDEYEEQNSRGLF